MSKPHAVIVSSDSGYLWYASSLINSLLLYGNEVDIHLTSCDNLPESFTKYFPAQVIYHGPQEYPPVVPQSWMSRCWWAQFFRYLLASRLASQYKTVSVFDADSFVCDDINDILELTASSKHPVMIRNELGYGLDQKYLDNFNAAHTPSFHCHGAFFPSALGPMLAKVFEWGTQENYCDMSELYRTILREGIEPIDIVALPNRLWCQTDFYSFTADMGTDDKGRPMLVEAETGLRIRSVHGRWKPESGYRADEVQNCVRLNPKGAANAKLFGDFFKIYLAKGPLKLG